MKDESFIYMSLRSTQAVMKYVLGDDPCDWKDLKAASTYLEMELYADHIYELLKERGKVR